MITTTKTLKLPEGEFPATVDIFEDKDLKALEDIYTTWRTLCDQTAALNARKINLPDGLSECGFCYFFKFWRTNYGVPGAKHSSFDAFDPNKCKRIQIKGYSNKEDLTSFGPNSVWDELYLVDFYVDGKWDYTFNVYLISNDDIYNTKVNATQTLADQQKQGKRPRFSIVKSIIRPKNMKPMYTCNIKTGKMIKHF